MAVQTDLAIVASFIAPKRFMRIMAGETGQCAAALLETPAFVQISRLMAHVPWVGPVHRAIREAMTSAAHLIQFPCRQSLRILNRFFSRGQIAGANLAHMRIARSMANFTTDARFVDLDFMAL